MRSPVISVILPVYNGERYLDQAICSCINQTFQDWELIIVDDGSVDGTPIIIKRYISTDDRIRSIRHETNKNLPASLNSGFALAQGEYLTWTSDDNLYKPEAFAELADFLDKNPQFAIVYSDYTTIDEKGEAIRNVRLGNPEGLACGNVVGACFLYRHEVHTSIGGYDVTKYLVEDLDFWIRASQKFRLAHLSKPLYLYRIHPGTLTTKRYSEIRNAHLSLIWESLPNMEWLSDPILSNGYAWLTNQMIGEGNIVLACRCSFKAIQYKPNLAVKIFLTTAYNIVRFLLNKLAKRIRCL